MWGGGWEWVECLWELWRAGVITLFVFFEGLLVLLVGVLVGSG